MSGINYSTKRRWQNRVRWTVASWLNRLPWTCWTNLVSWALHSRPLFARFGDGDIRQDRMCRYDLANGPCYCGKLSAEAPRRLMTRPYAATAVMALVVVGIALVCGWGAR